MVAKLLSIPRSVGGVGFSRAYNNYIFYRQMFKEHPDYTELSDVECSVIEAAILYCYNNHMLTAVNKTNELLSSLASTEDQRVWFGDFIAGWYGHNSKTRIGLLADAINYSGINDIVACLNGMYGAYGLKEGAVNKSLLDEMTTKQDSGRASNPPDLYIDLLTPVITYIDAEISSICCNLPAITPSADAGEVHLHDVAKSLLSLRKLSSIDSYMLKEI